MLTSTDGFYVFRLFLILPFYRPRQAEKGIRVPDDGTLFIRAMFLNMIGVPLGAIN